MKNKFEALATFQGWPKDWQQLCAEFWAEGEEPQEVRFDSRQLAIEPPQRAAKVKERRVEAWSIAQQEYLVECVNQCTKQKHAVEMFLARYPGRSVGAVNIKISEMKNANGVMHVRY